MCCIFQFYFIYKRFILAFNGNSFSYGLVNFKTFKIFSYLLLFLPCYNIIVFEPNHSIGLLFISLVLINIFCFSFWHHDLYLNTLFCLLVYLWFIFPDITFFDFSLFKFLILLQASFVYFITVINKLNREFINSYLLIEKIQFSWMRKYFFSKSPHFFNISIILIELFLSLIVFFYNSEYFFLYISIGFVFHFSIYLTTSLGRTYHLLLPSIYILIVPVEYQSLYLGALSILFTFYFYKLLMHKHIIKIL